jgi:antagonist of KipI
VEVFEVIHPGALTTVQDSGRYGYQRYGVPVSGAMDKFSLRVANLLVGNRENEPALEITVQGPTLRALRPWRVAFAGGDLSPKINGQPCLMWCSLAIEEGDLISFGGPRSGCRAYIGISGGISVPLIMGSYATHLRLGLGGFGQALIKGDVIRVAEEGNSFSGSRVSQPLAKENIPIYTKEWIIRVILGPQQEHFTPAGVNTFLGSDYVITPESDRMGYRLRGAKVEHRLSPDVITDATPPGSVQVPGDGMPIILVADAQATGGYAKIAVVITPDLNNLAQAKPGDKISFEKVTLLKAHQLLVEMENKIQKIKSSLPWAS